MANQAFAHAARVAFGHEWQRIPRELVLARADGTRRRPRIRGTGRVPEDQRQRTLAKLNAFHFTEDVMGAEAEDLYTDRPADSTQGWRTQAFAYNAKTCAGVTIVRMGALFSFRCCYCEKTVRLSAKQWSNAYRTLLDHVADCGREAGAGYDEMREYISAVMSDWPARPAPARD